ncbi:MAG: Rieske (2Fe-2S) protein [Rhizobiaceae bacterium]
MSQSASTKDGQIVDLGPYDELKSRDRMVFEADGVEVGVFFRDGEVRAWLNVCPHLGGPVCLGKIMPRTLEGYTADGRATGLQLSRTDTNIVCPWHGFEFNILTGEHPIDRRVKLRGVPVAVRDGRVQVTVPKRKNKA